LLNLVETTNTAEAEDSLPENGKIAFSRERGDASDIYTMDPNGSSASRLTKDTYYPDYQLDWSPDGTRIAFLGGMLSSVMVMDADGFNQRDLLTDSNRAGYYISDLTRSPNGTKLAFDSSSAADGIHNIYSINSDGSNPTNLTKTPKFDEAYPDFSPDGSRMCFNFENFGISGTPASGIYVMNANGSDPTLLIKSPNIEMVAEPGACDWSTDGTKIVFSGAFKEFDDSEVYVINADGSGRTALTSNLGEDRAGLVTRRHENHLHALLTVAP
jgi:Tol biopolymer transport system component